MGELNKSPIKSSPFVITAWGIRIWSASRSELIEHLISHPGPLQVVTLNSEMLHLAHRNREFLNLLRSPKVLCVVDGIGVKLALRFDLGAVVERIPGVELGLELAHGRPPVFLLGAKKEVVEEAAERLTNQGIQIAGFHHGYFGPDEVESILDKVISSQARTLLVALGSPRQEYFIAEHLGDLPHLVAVGVGGSFDVWSGKVVRAPGIVSRLGLEWLYRSLRPGRFHRLGRLMAFGWWVLLSKLSGQALFEDQMK